MMRVFSLSLLVLSLAAVLAPLLALRQTRRAERLAFPVVDRNRWLLVALLLIAFLSLGLFALVLVFV